MTEPHPKSDELFGVGPIMSHVEARKMFQRIGAELDDIIANINFDKVMQDMIELLGPLPKLTRRQRIQRAIGNWFIWCGYKLGGDE